MSTTPDLTLATVKMVISLGVVLAIIWGLYRLAKKNLPVVQGSGKGKMMHVLESQYLGMKKTITMVQIPGAILVLGVGSDKVNLLSRIDDPAIIKNLTTNAANHRCVLSFKDQFQRLTRSKSGDSQTGHNETVVE
jgi:flagellar protein FliO/FliZ